MTILYSLCSFIVIFLYGGIDMARKTLGLFDLNITQMGRALSGISKAASAIGYQKMLGNTSRMKSEIGRKGGFTKSYNSALKRSRNH